MARELHRRRHRARSPRRSSRTASCTSTSWCGWARRSRSTATSRWCTACRAVGRDGDGDRPARLGQPGDRRPGGRGPDAWSTASTTSTAATTAWKPSCARIGADIERRGKVRALITLALSKGRIFDEYAAAAAGGRHRGAGRPGDVAQADPRPPAGPTCAWCWCAPPTCRPTCSTAAPTSAWPARTSCSSTAAPGLYQPLDLKIARCRMSVAVRADFDYAAAVKQGSRIRVATKYTAASRASTSPTRACTST